MQKDELLFSRELQPGVWTDMRFPVGSGRALEKHPLLLQTEIIGGTSPEILQSGHHVLEAPIAIRLRPCG